MVLRWFVIAYHHQFRDGWIDSERSGTRLWLHRCSAIFADGHYRSNIKHSFHSEPGES